MTDPERLLEARVATLEAQIKFLLRLNGMDTSALREASDGDLLKCYQEAVGLLGIPHQKLPIETMERWVELFLQLSEVELVRIQGLVGYEYPWEPFYQLCTHFQTALRRSKRFTRDPGMKGLYGVLERARRNLRDGAVVMARKRPHNYPPKVKALLSGPSPDTP
jgi:hypothetical protein